MAIEAECAEAARLLTRYGKVRQRTLELCEPLTAEDMMVQSCPEASPAKWHLAHTAWFFESFVLTPLSAGYKPFHPDFHWLFNSYYASFAYFPEKRLRASFSRPGLGEVLAYRKYVDEAMERLLEGGANNEALTRTELGLNHEEQHQELLLTDILNAFFTNPLRPAYREMTAADRAQFGGSALDLRFVQFDGGLKEVGYAGQGFCYDNELPRHRVWLEPFALASRLVTCGEYAEFMADGGYRRQELWLSAGWDTVKAQGWNAPLYWTQREDAGANNAWSLFTLRGAFAVEDVKYLPVAHVSFFEADAYARWAGVRLATEFEWEAATEGAALDGNLLNTGKLMPTAAANEHAGCLQCFGDAWEWTASAYLGYPGYKPLGGALGEYNGKFMSGQMVLRGGSCVTPPGHIRASYRNFFAPETRWQFSAIRLAR
jgi:ergothioneine biosynthesis protein EgtB